MNQKQYRKLYYEKNKNKLLERHREWARKNKDKLKLSFKKWREKNKDKLKEYQKNWRGNNKEKLRKYQNLWREKNRSKWTEYSRNKYYSRRKEFLEGKKCAKCGINDWRVLTFDHIKSVSTGGDTVKDNLQILCWNCHRIKSIENRDWRITRRKIKTRSFNPNYSKARLREFLETT